MSFTSIDTQKVHSAYEQMTDEIRKAIDNAFTACRLSLKQDGIGQLANDDRAEELIGAIAYYVMRSENKCFS
jgi:hypothetical protein